MLIFVFDVWLSWSWAYIFSIWEPKYLWTFLWTHRCLEKGFGTMKNGIYRRDVKIDLYDFKPYTLLNFEIQKFYDKYKNEDLRFYIEKNGI